ncbi:MAG: methyltransferase family protein [Armatimonadota bacterium]
MLVPFVLIGIAWYLGPQTLPVAATIGGILCVAVGATLRLWACGHLHKDVMLVHWGPFRYTRNPLYLGTWLIGIGFGILSGRWESCALVAVIILVFYLPTVQQEEQFLAARFGDAYAEYCSTVPRWLPRLLPHHTPAQDHHYRWELVRHHREHIHLAIDMVFLIAFGVVYFVKVLP